MLGIGLKHLGLRVKRAFQGIVRVGLESRMPGIVGQETDGLENLLEKPFLSG